MGGIVADALRVLLLNTGSSVMCYIKSSEPLEKTAPKDLKHVEKAETIGQVSIMSSTMCWQPV